MTLFRQLVLDEQGQDLAEYALLIAFIGALCILALQNLGTALNNYAKTHNAGMVFGAETGFLVSRPGEPETVLAPDVAFGPLPLTVTTPGGTSATFTVTSNQYGPAFFEWPNAQPVATRQDFSWAVKNGTFPGTTTVPAKPGDVIILWGNGFGPTNPVAPVGMAVPSDKTYSTTTLPTVTINNVPAPFYGAALAPGFAGLYQIAIQVPASITDGDWPIQASIGGVQSPTGVLLSVHQ